MALGILQLHPTRKCNLQCIHCYSDSGPFSTDEIPLDALLDALQDAAALGYQIVSVSGGEPLLYKGLLPVLEASRRLSMQTQLVTNGILLNEKTINKLNGYVDLLAISLDGPEADHDRMRGQVGAFKSMMIGVSSLRDADIPFGFLFTLTQNNVHQLEWAADFALENGASLLQIHPLESVGRAQSLSSAVPDSQEETFACLEAFRIKSIYGEQLRIQLDLATKDQVSASNLCEMPQESSQLRLADMVSPLVIEPDGTCVPLEYGFSRSFQLGNIRSDRLLSLAKDWRQGIYPMYREVLDSVADSIREDKVNGLVCNWYTLVAAHADKLSV